jgi:sigma-B regulation protein RsbU (phosphoserine phosphatase)
MKVPAVVESLEPVNVLVHSLAVESGLSSDGAYRLRLAAEELFVNIVRHAYGPGRPDAEIVVEGDVAEDRVWLRLVDSAARFDPFRTPNPTGLDRPLKDREPGALGLYLTRHAVDTATHEYVDGTNRSTITILRVPQHGDERTDNDRDGADRQRM